MKKVLTTLPGLLKIETLNQGIKIYQTVCVASNLSR